MKKDCVFCRIIKREISTHLVFEDEKTLAFLDNQPLSEGHTLIIPKTHVAVLQDLGREDADALFKTVYRAVGKIQDAVNAPATTIALNNGAESGQVIPHIHVHIIPRFKNDKGGSIHAMIKERRIFDSYDMVKIARRIQEQFKTK